MKVSALDLRREDLILSHFSLERSGGFAERVDAAAAAGYSGIGLYVMEYQRLRDEVGRTPAQIRRRLESLDLCLAEIEVARGWANTGELARQGRELEALAFEMADEFGCRYLQAIGPYEGSVADAAAGFAALCDRAAPHGLLVGIEFLPFTNIRTAADALEIVELADRPNGGICVDIWHHKRGADDIALIEALPSDRVFAVQLSDGPMKPEIDDYYRDCLDNRLPPGTGEFGVGDFVAVLDRMGVDVPLSVEVCSAELRSGPPATAARLSADALRSLLRNAA